MIRAVIIDDESSGRVALQKLLEKHSPEIEIEGTAESVESGKKLIDELAPELVFLDIEMPDGTGFDLLSSFDRINFEVIFVTAFNDYAINAFKFSAVDYLVKPVDIEELKSAVGKAEEKIADQTSKKNFEVLIQNLKNPNAQLNQIALPTLEGLTFVPVSDIMRCEANEYNTWFYLTDGSKLLVTKTLKDFEHLLLGHHFFRVHKSHLVNLNQIKNYIRGAAGYIVLTDNKEVPISRRKKEAFLKLWSK